MVSGEHLDLLRTNKENKMPKGVVPRIDRLLSSVKACDRLVLKKTVGKEPPDINFYEHFVFLYVKKEKVGWVSMGYRCKHCEKIAATTQDLAALHLHICLGVKRSAPLRRQIFNLEKTE